MSIPYLAFLDHKLSKLSKFLTFNLQIDISVEICFIVMFNYVYFGLTVIPKGGDEAKQGVK